MRARGFDRAGLSHLHTEPNTWELADILPKLESATVQLIKP